MKRSSIVLLALCVVLTTLAVILGGDFGLFVRLQSYYLVGFGVLVLVAYLTARRGPVEEMGRERLRLRFVEAIGSCAVCFGLIVTIIGLLRTIWCARRLLAAPGDVLVAFLPLLYCLAIAEVLCPALEHHFSCRITRANGPASEPEPKTQS